MSPVSCSSRARCIFLFLCACFLLPALRAQSTKADIQALLKDKPLYLRGFWWGDKLNFDSSGQLVGRADPVSFTVCGFDLKDVDLKPDRLVLEGRRVGLKLAGDKQRRIPLDKHIRIEIAASPNGDYGPALDAIFVDGLDKLVPSLPPYWKSYAEKNFLPTSTTASSAASTNSDSQSQDITPKKIGGAVSPPKLLSSVEPKFNSVARVKGTAATSSSTFT